MRRKEKGGGTVRQTHGNLKPALHGPGGLLNDCIMAAQHGRVGHGGEFTSTGFYMISYR